MQAQPHAGEGANSTINKPYPHKNEAVKIDSTVQYPFFTF